VTDDVLAIGVAHDLAVQPAGLNEIIVFGVLLIRVALKLAGVYQPAEHSYDKDAAMTYHHAGLRSMPGTKLGRGEA
jgi:hypothetical protein